MTLRQYLERLQLRHFSPSEVMLNMDRSLNSIPDRSLWPNIVLPLTVLDELRAEYRKPITITSCYRSPEYNRAVGGTPRSQHVAFAAIDFKVKTVAPALVAATLRSWRDRTFHLAVQIERIQFEGHPFSVLPAYDERGGLTSMMPWTGGVGEYSTFTHLDSRGAARSWSGA